MGSPLSPMHHAVPTNGTATYVDDMEDQFEDALESHTHSSPSQQRRSTGDDSSLGLGLDGASSPFVASVDDQSQSSNQDNHSPSKDKRRSRIMSGSEISPLKMLQRSSTDGPIPEADEKLAPPAPKSPRKSVSPMRRFPVKINNSIDSTARSRPQSMHAAPRDRQMSYSEDPSSPPTPPAATPSSPTTNGTTTHQETEMTLEEAIAQNPGVKHAIEIFEDSISSIDDDDDDDDDDDNDSGLDGQGGTVKGPMDTPTPPSDSQDDTAGDETMMSTFSNFSAIPNLTTFARLGGRTPTQMARQDPRRESNSTNLLDFTDNQRFPAGGRTSPTKNLSMADAKKTPQRQNIANLLDFDIPPMPTPRSLPSITARELESLKSNFMSEISGLRATLSGKDAEVVSLKTALGSAEKRAGETMEHLREERSLREQYSEEKDMWEKRGREMETVLRQVKEEIMKTSREREEFESKLEESEGRREAAEMMAQEAEARMASMRAREASAEARAEAAASPGGGLRSPGSRASQREIEIAVEKVARELHAAYKKKHEDKVAALKKTYEGRWDKKIRELEGRIGELAQENEELKLGRDATITKVEFERAAVEEERKAQAIKDSAQIKELQAEVEKLEAVVRTVQDDNADLRQQLEGERVEKGELVTLAEELMQMQAQQQSAAAQQQQQIEQQLQEKQQQQRHEPPPQQQQQQHHAVPAVTPKRVPQRASAPPPARSNTTGGGGFSRPSTMTPKKAGGVSPSGVPGTTKSGYRNSMIGRPGGGGLSGLKPPGSSKIGGGGGVVGVAPAHGRTQSTTGGGSGIGRPGSGLARPGGLMSSIQQMGSYRGGGRGE